MSKPRQPKTIEAARLIRPQAKIDLVLEIDYLTSQADIRHSTILEHSPGEIIIAQTSPPIYKSLIGSKLEASIVHHTAIQSTRWGWTATILHIDNDYILNPDSPDPVNEPALAISPPPRRAELIRSNVRQAYRLDADRRFGITLTVEPEVKSILLLNFSAGGMMLSTNKPAAFSLGQEIDFELAFPPQALIPLHTVKGKAAVMRMEISPHNNKQVSLGLKFSELNEGAQKALPKILNYYMLQEQRFRSRFDG